MTTLEIKRLDSPVSPKQSPIHKLALRDLTRTSNELLHEIPISIIKSPSYSSSLNRSNSSSTSPKETQQKLLLPGQISLSSDGDGLDKNKTIAITNSSTNIMDKTNQQATSSATVSSMSLNQNNKLTTSTTSGNSSSNQLNTSDDIDDVININSSTLAGELEMKSQTLRFNKYGFVQPEYSTNTINGDSVNSSKQPINGASSVHSLTTDKSLSTNDSQTNTNKRNTVRPITNLKDYIQNTDVEEFSENLPIETIRLREEKWIHMLKHFNDWMERRFKKIKSRCRKGIPQSMRSRAWMHLTGAFVLKNSKPKYYQDCLNNVKQLDVDKYLDDIKKDLHRQFPSHEIFMKREGRQMLFNVLKAYAVHNKEVGYCQAQGPIAALLLMHMPEEDSFWMLVRISDYYLKGYFKPGLEKVQIDGQALFHLFKKENPVAFKLMKSQGIDPILYMTEWFMCVFARTLPWCTVLRVWDMFFCEGVKVLYRVGLHLMLSAFKNKEQFQRCESQGMYETLNLIKNLPIEALAEETLVEESSKIKFSEDEFKKAYEKSGREFENNRPEKRKQPNR